MSKVKGQIVKAVRIGSSDAGRVVGQSLKNLRELAGMTQAQMAKRLSVGQAAISKIEHRGDVQISSLQKYVEALGARLRIEATFRPEAMVKHGIAGAFDAETLDDNQLVFPIFGDDLFKPQRDVILSIRPQYSEKIMHGEKTVELRRRFPLSAPQGTIAYIYCTSPVRAIVGSAQISDVVKLPVEEIWKKYRNSAAIGKAEFDSYFDGLHKGFALKFANVRPLPRKVDLSELRERFGFEPPQSFLYASPLLRRALEHEFADIPN